MNIQEYERRETARLDEMYDARYSKFDDYDSDYEIIKQNYEEQFANAVLALFIRMMQEQNP